MVVVYFSVRLEINLLNNVCFFGHVDAVITWDKRALTFEDLHILPLSDNSYRDDSLQSSHDTVKILAVIQRDGQPLITQGGRLYGDVHIEPARKHFNQIGQGNALVLGIAMNPGISFG